MGDYVITKVAHGFLIRENVGNSLIPRQWAYSTLDEALDGLRKLYEEQANDTK